jgi:hypothetical protein
MHKLNGLLIGVVLFAAGCAIPTPMETVLLPADKSEWKMGYAKDFGGGKGAIMEHIPKSEAISNWSKMVTVQFLENSKEDPKVLMIKLREQMTSRCKETKWNILEENTTSVLYEWRISNCRPHDDQHEIARLLKGNEGLHRVAYTEKVTSIQEGTRNLWIKWLKENICCKGR